MTRKKKEKGEREERRGYETDTEYMLVQKGKGVTKQTRNDPKKYNACQIRGYKRGKKGWPETDTEMRKGIIWRVIYVPCI